MSEAVNPEITKEELDAAENEVFVKHLDAYVEGGGDTHPDIVAYRDCVNHESPRRNLIGRRALRGYAGKAVKDDFGFRDPFLKVMREIATEMAISYFKSLKRYLEAKETGDVAVDAIVREVALSSGILLRQIEGALENFNVPREFWDLDFGTEALQKIIDFDRFERERVALYLFEDGLSNHYVGVDEEYEPLGITHSASPGLREWDILFFLNSLKDVGVAVDIDGRRTSKVVFDSPVVFNSPDIVARICKNGIVEILKMEG